MQHSHSSSTNTGVAMPPPGSNQNMEESAAAAAQASVSEGPMEMSIDDMFIGASPGANEQIHQIYQMLQQDDMDGQSQHVAPSTNQEHSGQMKAFASNQDFPLQLKKFTPTDQKHSLQPDPFSAANQESRLHQQTFVSTSQEHPLQQPFTPISQENPLNQQNYVPANPVLQQQTFSSTNHEHTFQQQGFASTNHEQSIQPALTSTNQERHLQQQTFMSTQTFSSTNHDQTLQQQDFALTNQQQQQPCASTTEEHSLQQQHLMSPHQEHSVQQQTFSVPSHDQGFALPDHEQPMQQQQQPHASVNEEHSLQQPTYMSTHQELALQQQTFPSTNQEGTLQQQNFTSTNQEQPMQQQQQLVSSNDNEHPSQKQTFMSTHQEHALPQQSFASTNHEPPMQQHQQPLASASEEHALQQPSFRSTQQEHALQQQTFSSTNPDHTLRQSVFALANCKQPMQQQQQPITPINNEHALQQQTFVSSHHEHALQPKANSSTNLKTFSLTQQEHSLQSEKFLPTGNVHAIIQQQPFTSTNQELSFQQQQGQAQLLQQQQHQQPQRGYTSGHNTNIVPSQSSNYRNNPADNDEASNMAFMHEVSGLSLVTEDTTPYVGSCHQSPVISDYDTISALLEPSSRIHIADDQGPDAGYSARGDYDESPRKMSRVGIESSVDVDKLLSTEVSPASNKEGGFIFQKFGMKGGADISHSFFPGDSGSQVVSHDQMMTSVSLTSSASVPAVPSPIRIKDQYFGNEEEPASNATSYRPDPSVSLRRKRLIHKSPPLTDGFRDRHENIILKLLKQPEAQHRARYMTEGSRGAVKDAQQTGHPVVQLLGWNEEAKLEIFIGVDSGKVKPHGFYQVTRISGKNASASRERQMDGTNVIEMEFDSNKNMTALIDCVGILKLRNTDVEKRIGPVKKKKNNTKCRLIYRVNLVLPSGKLVTLQTASSVIACTQPAGQPEICRMSLDKAPMDGGGLSLFVIGKNFIKNFQVKFQQLDKDSDQVVWERRSEVDSEYIQTTHFICAVPAYIRDEQGDEPVSVQVVVETSGGVSEPMSFTYQPETCVKPVVYEVMVSECTSDHSTASISTAHPMISSTMVAAGSQESPPISIVSPEALELVAQLQQQQSNGPASKIFQIPEGVDFISQDANNFTHRSSCDKMHSSGDFKPIAMNNRVISSSHFQTGAPSLPISKTGTLSDHPTHPFG